MLIENVHGQSIFIPDLKSESKGINGFMVPLDSGIINLTDFFTRDEIMQSMFLRKAEKLGWIVDPRIVKQGRQNFRGVNKFDPNLRAMNMKVLVHRGVGGIGDLILLTPVFRAIKENFPNAHLTFATTKSYYQGTLLDIPRGNPFIDYLCTIEEARMITEEFDYNINMACPANRYEVANMRTPKKVDKDRTQIFCDYLGLMPSTMKPDYVVSQEEMNWIPYYKREHGIPKDAKLVGLVPKTENRTRSWERHKWYTLTQLLIGKGLTPLIFDPDANGKKNIPGAHFVCGIPFRQVAALVSALDLLITPDTGMMHLGGALSIPMVTLFGSIGIPQRIIHYDRTAVVEHMAKFECMPCWYVYPKRECWDEKMGHEVALCMEEITVMEVWEKANRVLNGDETVFWKSDAALAAQQKGMAKV